MWDDSDRRPGTLKANASPFQRALQTLISYDIRPKMSDRATLLIRCSVAEAAMIRDRARAERRTLGNYVLNIVARALRFEEKFSSRGIRSFRRARSGKRDRAALPRTAILLRCSVDERRRIHEAAERNDITISGFVLRCLTISWRAKAAVNAKAL